MQRNLTAVLALSSGIGAAILLVTGASVALALPNEPNITLCHATPPDTAAQGYVEITVDANSVFKQGHGTRHDADIIPAFDYTDAQGDTVHYPGKNLDHGGQAILDNGCEEVAPPTTTTPTTTTATTTTNTTTTSTTTTGTTSTATSTSSHPSQTRPSQTGGGNSPGGRPIPSGAVDAGGTGLYDSGPSGSPAAILLLTGGLLTVASAALTVRWRRQTT